ncbi:AraC family transcriptional regulator [Spongiivirga citrea]|uniref:Helix-turn-helix domain-containing protein n=1 Tax=Spongiivirga citrea TaxID=1481457 RepID=A0A6M0CQE6_9FLAO|nr:AraC family transcriptional regulator [Spongiivirga citrea]NER19143.1 helix-turn-helix domain-containing protein [Spongiivirga citrea]
MKVFPFKIPKPEYKGLIYQEDHEYLFYDKLHQHEEIQISYIVNGEGSLVVGDTITSYKKDDVFVIGSNIPHVFRSEPKTEEKSKMLSLFFTKDSFGKGFFKLDDFTEIASFFERATHGMKFSPISSEIKDYFLLLKKASKQQRFILLLQIIDQITKTKSTSIASYINPKRYSDNEGQRLRTIFEYTINNYHTPITLEAISEVASMTKNAFCRYFKTRTNKTYFQFLNEVRIENASRLLLNDQNISIVEVAYLSGFNNLSNFNRKFKTIKGVTPSRLRNSHKP